MKNKKIIIKNGAIFISDAHEGATRKGFWEFLKALENKEIKTRQLILMGDIFDMLVGEVKATHDFAKPYIALLEELASEIEVLYLEGNHDFNLSRFFEKVQVFSLQNQPLLCAFEKSENSSHSAQNLNKSLNLKDSLNKNLNENTQILNEFCFASKNIKKVFLAHGDIFLPPLLAFALKALRNKPLLVFLNFIDKMLNFKISKQILKKKDSKNLFFKLSNLKEFATQRYKKYPENKALVIEGHFHQNFILDTKINNTEIKYINLATFAYERSFFVVEYADKIKFQEKKLREKHV